MQIRGHQAERYQANLNWTYRWKPKQCKKVKKVHLLTMRRTRRDVKVKKIIEFELSIIVVFVVSRQKKARSPLFPHQLQSREPGSNIRTQNGIFRALWALVAFNWRGNGGGGVLSVWRERTKAKQKIILNLIISWSLTSCRMLSTHASKYFFHDFI